MRMYDLIMKKRGGNALTAEEIDYLIQGYTKDSIPDYQMSAFLMAVYFQGMTDEELSAFTLCMDSIKPTEIRVLVKSADFASG